MKLKLTITFLFIGIFASFSQNFSKEISGKVMHFNNSITDAHIYNISTKQGTSSDANGEFKISAKLKDTLSISHIKYTNRKIIVTKKILNQSYPIFYLEVMTNYLETVELKNHNLSGLLLTDAKKISTDSILKASHFIEEMMRIAKLPSKNTELFNREASYVNDVDPISMNGARASIGIPMRDKENELRRELRRKKNTPERIIADFGVDYFIKKLKIPEDKIFNFLTYCDYRNIFDLYNNNEIMKVLNILTVESTSFNKIEE
ncbi:MAG: carboxypeptidase-like regulatory domain-containing protein [Urechidicola sp.]|nr:carboxypeptidase-like regulatory domain-containing protein [Urechidicola sp.]